MRPDSVAIPYCGLPPDPGALWSRWNLDPVLIAIIIAIAICYAVATPSAMRRGQISPGNTACFFAGWFVLASALVSPLCALSVSLFSARVSQHMIVVLIAAPLLVAGRPGVVARTALSTDYVRPSHRGNFLDAFGASAAFAIALWFWHMPLPYDATFDSDVVYWTMHVTMILSALWLWSILLDRRRDRAVSAIATGLVASTQMSLLGAAITFATHPLYAPHLLTTAAWGTTPLVDQQLGGAIMWVPGGAIFLTAAMFILIALVGNGEHSRPQPVRLRVR